VAEYNKEEITRIEEYWRSYWDKHQVFKAENDPGRPKYYVLDMFPYPSGAGLHVGHPLGYIASDIVARYKRIKGFNVLHPMGFDAFGLPAEQYALEHGIHPAISTQQNIQNFKRQLGKIGFSFDWSREVQTCNPSYYKWTQWIFLQIFDSWFNRKQEKAERISALITLLEKEGNTNHPFPNTKSRTPSGSDRFSSTEWKAYDKATQHEILMNYRLAYLAYTDVNWCEALGTVLANDEVINGVSYRGGFPVVKRQMRQWSLRITEYAERLLKGLNEIDFSESMKDIQRNWIGKSIGCLVKFAVKGQDTGLTPGPSPKERGTIDTANKNVWPILKEYAKANRTHPTAEEAILWERLRNNQVGHKIRRQHTIGIFIADFVCLDKQLVIEVDGEYHSKNPDYDKERTAYLLVEGLEVIRFTNSEVKSNSEHVAATIKAALDSRPSIDRAHSLSFGEGRGEALEPTEVLEVFTTRPDTIFGVDFMVLAPEHPLVKSFTTPEQKDKVEEYIKYVESRSEIDRMAEVKKVTGCFTGAYAINPLSNREVPIWISEYVLVGYGTGAIMGVPCGDERDHKFAKHFQIPITNIIGKLYNGEEANPSYDAILENSGEYNGLVMRDAIPSIVEKLETMGVGKKQVNYKMRDAGWSRQRYWGEPFPVEFRDDVTYAMADGDLPLELPEATVFKPSGSGEGPLANLQDWINPSKGVKRDSNTMPTHAGAAWYFLRYMDPHNPKEFAGRKALDYWNQVDVYIGGSEHAVAHLLYARLWVKILHDLGYLGFDEPFKKLINQGKITGDSRFVYRVRGSNKFVSAGLISRYETDPLHVDVNIVNGHELNVEAFRRSRPDYASAEFVLEDGKYLCGSAIEKMSKSKYNVVNPDDIADKYGADTLRMYEMFLGPLEASKPWSTNGIDGVYKFLRRFWNLFHDSYGKFGVSEAAASKDELRVLHRTLKKVESDIESYSFNTSVSEFMICVNELTSLKCNKRSVVEPLVIALSPFAPHIAEELWSLLGHSTSIQKATFPAWDEQYLRVISHAYPISINGKVRATMEFALDMPIADIEKQVLASEILKKWSEGKTPKKVIIVPGRIVNVVL
jgi:leucyl-tRNA synthetase